MSRIPNRIRRTPTTLDQSAVLLNRLLPKFPTTTCATDFSIRRFAAMVVAGGLCCLMFAVAATLGHSQPPADAPQAFQRQNDDLDGRTIEYWIEQLASDSYSRRQRSSVILEKAGNEAISALAEATKSGDFEVITRAIRILQRLAVRQSIEDEGGAVEELTRIAADSVGSRGVVARDALSNIVSMRSDQAYEALNEAGVFIGQSTFVPTSPRMMALIRIDDAWNGDVDVLRWLRWIRDIDTVVLNDKACRDDVLIHVSRMPALTNVQLNNGDLSRRGLESLTNLQQIRVLIFNYVQFDQQPTDTIVRLPLVESLRMFGTNLDSEGAETIRDTFPGVLMEITKGAFLGVQSDMTATECRIQSVISGGAAEKAGLIAGDVIVELNGKPIKDFFDLKDEIAKADIREEIEIKVRRGPGDDANEVVLKAVLGRQDVQ
ncbi:PDZ domain-containing protein [Crateriforma conspicua]|uniref:PDZ domain-containing protein n=1 Tax=Crateriforma conspicua TaxID=2527996 RepID=UPI0013FCFE52|nr:PDZ domain-containing protein [Crateriforma conspicua]